MNEGGAPPPEAMRRGVGKGVFVLTMVIVLALGFVAGIVAQPFIVSKPAALLIGTNTPFPPFESGDGNNVVGFDMDLIAEIMKRAGRDYEIVNFRDFTALLSSIEAGQINVGASAITMSGTTGATRNSTMDFTDPYFESDQAVLVRKGFTAVTCAPDPTGCVGGDLEGFKVATQAGTTSEFWVADNVPGADDNLTTYPDVTQALQALKTSAVDVVVIDKPAGDGIVAASPNDYEVEGAVQTNELYGFAVANNDPLGLVPKMNSALAAMKTDGTYNTILDKWF